MTSEYDFMDEEMDTEAKNRARALIGSESPSTPCSAPTTIYCLGNKTANMFFEDKDDAEKTQANFGAASGLEITPITVIPSSKRPNVRR